MPPESEPPANALFSAGDLVQLKSGGPLMTVEGHDTGSNQVRLVWADKDGQLQQRTVLACVLKPGDKK